MITPSADPKPRPIRLRGPRVITIDRVDYPVSLPIDITQSWTMSGRPRWVYVMVHGSGKTAKSKIGISRNPDQRLADINASSPVPVRLHSTWQVPDYAAFWIEQAAHDVLRHKHSHAEWFNCDQHLAAHAVSLVFPYAGTIADLWSLRLKDNQKWRAIVSEFRARASEELC